MKTTLNLPDDLMKAVKIRAAETNRSLQSTIAELLRRALLLEKATGANPDRRVKLPLVTCVHEAPSDQDLTPDRVAEILDLDDLRAAHGSL